jgi:argininosuccinate lyase
MLSRASEHSPPIMPAYSHLQQSQPCTFGHYLLAFADAFFSGRDRLKRELTWVGNMETKTTKSYEKLRRVAKAITKATA